MSVSDLTPDDIRRAVAERPKLRPRDIAETLGLGEAALVAAQVGRTAVQIAADPDSILPRIPALGEVMALTRTRSVVHEKVGTYTEFHPGDHAAMVLGADIDLRIFPRHWVHAWAVETDSDGGVKRSIQVFDPAGDAIHKIHLRAASHLPAWDSLVADLRSSEQSETVSLAPRAPVEAAKVDTSKVETLRAEWRRLTDTHQFLRLTRKLKLNRLGAYRIAGAPFVRRLAPGAVTDALQRLAESGTPVMVFVGNAGCIQIHTGPIHKVAPMGPWQNVMDPNFNLHLRADHVAEVWAVEKPTKAGPALSIEAFDDQGALICQVFGVRKQDADYTGPWSELVAALPEQEAVV